MLLIATAHDLEPMVEEKLAAARAAASVRLARLDWEPFEHIEHAPNNLDLMLWHEPSTVVVLSPAWTAEPPCSERDALLCRCWFTVLILACRHNKLTFV